MMLYNYDDEFHTLIFIDVIYKHLAAIAKPYLPTIYVYSGSPWSVYLEYV